MKEITVGTLIAVFQEVFGPILFWGISVSIILVSIVMIYVLHHERGLNQKSFLISQISLPFGAFISAWIALQATSSSLQDIGGAIDVLLLLLIMVFGAFGIGMSAYVIVSVSSIQFHKPN